MPKSKPQTKSMPKSNSKRKGKRSSKLKSTSKSKSRTKLHEHCDELWVSLNDPIQSSPSVSSSASSSLSPSRVGGKAASLARLYSGLRLRNASSNSNSNCNSNPDSKRDSKPADSSNSCGLPVVVPGATALTVDFFRPWVDRLLEGGDRGATETDTETDTESATAPPDKKGNRNSVLDRLLEANPNHCSEIEASRKRLCAELGSASRNPELLPLTPEQSSALGAVIRELALSAPGSTKKRKQKDKQKDRQKDKQKDKQSQRENRSAQNKQWLAVRSSAPEEDGAEASFAGAFESFLGVACEVRALERAVRDCFASLWDYRVWNYKVLQPRQQTRQRSLRRPGFCVVVMELVDSVAAGVAFSANPLNSDRDELVLESSWGLGSSVVDGSVTADRYVVDKLAMEAQLRRNKKSGSKTKSKNKTETTHARTRTRRSKHKHNTGSNKSNPKPFVLEESIGTKASFQCLDRRSGVVETRDCSDAQRSGSSLDEEQILALAGEVAWVEKELYHGEPVDVEWALVGAPAGAAGGGNGNDNGNDNGNGVESESPQQSLCLLQARPITTLYQLDHESMATQPGEKRRLYIDFNVASEATTTMPFSRLDHDVYGTALLAGLGAGCEQADRAGFKLFGSIDTPDPNRIFFNGRTRQFANLGIALNYVGPKAIAGFIELMDPYMASILDSKDCDRKKYRTGRWIPRGVNPASARKVLRLLRPWKMYTVGRKYTQNPEAACANYREIVRADLKRLTALEQRASVSTATTSLKMQSLEICAAVRDSVLEECAAIQFAVLDGFREVDEQRRNGKTEEDRADADALCSGYEGDELMELNIALYELAHSLPESIWNEYDHNNQQEEEPSSNSGKNHKNQQKSMTDLAERIRMCLLRRNGNQNGDGKQNDDDNDEDEDDLPESFLTAWETFLTKYGFDGEDQLFVSCPRYKDRPELLLHKLRLNAPRTNTNTFGGGGVRDPAVIAKSQLAARRAVQAKHEAKAGEALEAAQAAPRFHWGRRRAIRNCRNELEAIRKRNALLDHVFWMRNAPKLHLCRVVGAIRSAVLATEREVLSRGMLREEGDIFHLTLDEIDAMLRGEPPSPSCSITGTAAASTSWIDVVRPRKAVYQTALSSNRCPPLLVDSRCRILRPDPPLEEAPEGTLVGTPISPGIATGKVRIVRSSLGENFRPGEVLCAIVTGPAWTPLFASAAAVVLRIGGALQHGALCAREYGKPAVSNVAVMEELRDGMTVEVDGTRGTVTILDYNSGGDGDKDKDKDKDKQNGKIDDDDDNDDKSKLPTK